MTQAASSDGSAHEVVLTRDVPYGEAPIGHGGNLPGRRTLFLDVYAPLATGAAAPDGGRLRPALILSHGGAYHRGTKEEDLFEQDGRRNTPVAEYCRRFAARGYVCFSVGYRLTQECPPPQAAPIRRHRGQLSRGRIDHVRELLGLPVASDAQLLDGMEAASADVALAGRFVHSHAERWGIDPERIALGGFSAGAFSSAYAAYALGVPAAAIVSLSGGMDPVDAAYYVHGARGQPPVLLFSSEFDLPGIGACTEALAGRAAEAGLGVWHYAVPGAPHFYDHETRAELRQSTLAGAATACSIEQAIAGFLDAALAVPRVTPDMLQVFADAWNRHDIEALMSFMSEDCVFHASSGPDASGTRYRGREAVRAGFMKAWSDLPDVQWTRSRHTVAGRRGLSEWTLLGTRASDGQRVEVDGCDLFTFQGDKIRVKDSWRKQRAVPAA